MDSLKIKTGSIRLLINDGPDLLEFDPNDVAFAERFYQVIQEFESKKQDYEKRAEDLDSQAKDPNGLPQNTGAALAFLREVCEYMRNQIDYLFGPGTSQKAFGNSLNLDLFEQFFVGITPYVQKARSEKVKKYTGKGQRVLR